jgi:hypothetical protein
MKVSDLERTIRTEGLRGVCLDLCCRSGYKLCKLIVMHVLVLAPAGGGGRSLAAPEGFTHRLLDEADLRRCSDLAEFEMSREFLEAALAKGDRCHGILQEGRLVSYGWYAGTPTRVTGNLTLSFAPGWLYAYKGFTLPAYRGLRLHDFGLTAAPGLLGVDPLRGVLALVDANNFSSLRCMDRAGYRIRGRIRAARLGGRWQVRLDDRCREFGLALTTDPRTT